MIRAIADTSRIVKYIDMPLQHIEDRVLKLMKRKVTRNEIETLLGKLNKWVPGMAIRTTFIAGSPTETEAEHQSLVKFVKDFQFEHMGVFPYSAEPGTPMGRLQQQHDDETKARWVENLMLTQQDVVFERNKGRVGQTMEVLIERPAGRDLEDGYVARSAAQAPDIDSVTYVSSHKKLSPGEVVDVAVTDFQAYDLVAKIPRKKQRSLNVVSA